MDQKRVGAFLKELRKGKGITQEQLAETMEVSSRTVSRWETGSNLPDFDVLIALADYYDVEIREILDGERKSEKMTEEEKKTMQSVADYAGSEKASLLKRVRVISIIWLAALLIGLIMEAISPDSGIPIFETVKGVCLGLSVGTMITMVLYTTGLLAKIKSKRPQRTRKMAIICMVISAIFLIVSVIASVL